MTKNDPDIRKAHCNSCVQETNHRIIASRKKRHGKLLDEYDPDSEIYVVNTYEMLECCGCENISLRRTSWFSEEPQDLGIDYYPPAVSRPTPQWSHDLPFDERSLLDEVYATLHAGSRRTAMMGARALIDIALMSKVGDQGSFAKTLAEGEKQGFISRSHRTVLEAAFEAGSAAAHRGYNASVEEVNQVIDIVENLLHSVYVLESLAQNLRQKTPPRKKASQKKSAPKT